MPKQNADSDKKRIPSYHLALLDKIIKLKGEKTDLEFQDLTDIKTATWQSWKKFDMKTKTEKEGFRRIGIESLLRISKAFDVSLDWLFGITSGTSDWENDVRYLFRILVWILEDELTDWSIVDAVVIDDKADKTETVIVLKNDLFEEFIEDYREIMESEDSYGNDKAFEDKEALMMEFVKRYVDSIKKKSSNV